MREQNENSVFTISVAVAVAATHRSMNHLKISKLKIGLGAYD